LKSCKRVLGVATGLILALSLTMTAPEAEAAPMTSSEAIIAVIKNYEGFRSKVYWESGTAYIGYGTSCNHNEFPNGITREQADIRMRNMLKDMENDINKFLSKYDIQLSQNQFDALMSFTYNLGNIWMNSGCRLYNYLINGIDNYSDIQIVNAIGTWCHQGKSVNNLLVKRRLHEAKIFLYGDYDETGPHQYRYLTFDAGKGEVENSIVFFEYGLPYGVIQPATLGGKTFAGWITEDGTYITPSTIVEKNLAVSAVWSDGPVTVPGQNKVFPDVKETDWYYTYVTELSAANIISGLPDGSFGPDQIISYGEVLKLVLCAVGFDLQPPADSHWAGGYMKLAASKGLVDPGAVPDLNAPVTRLEIAHLTAKALGLPPLDPETRFADTTDGFVLALYHCGIVVGIKNDAGELVYNPWGTMTRAEMCAVIWRVGKSDALPY
jgi:GH24 family phage-related lysozyme (muramidase)